MLLEPHQNPPGQPKTEIDAVYGLANERTAIAQQMARSVRLLQTVTERVANAYMWPVPFTLEMQSCGFPNARWDLSTHKLILCYELAAEFADLYREFGARSEDIGIVGRTKRRATATSHKSGRQLTQDRRKPGS
jgi:hypothetical protein